MHGRGNRGGHRGQGPPSFWADLQLRVRSNPASQSYTNVLDRADGAFYRQGVVTYTLPVETFATGIKNFDRWKSSLIAWSLRSEALDRLSLREFKGQNVATPAKYLKCVDHLILVAQNSSWSLDRLLKRTLITWFHFNPGCKHFYRWHLYV